MAIPYARREAYDPRGSRIADLILAAGQAQARGAERGGQIIAGTLGNLGDIGASFVQQRAASKQAEAEKAKEQQLLGMIRDTGGMPDPVAVVGMFGREKGVDILKGLSSVHSIRQAEAAEKAQHAQNIAKGFLSLSDSGAKAALWPSIVQTGVESGILPKEVAAQIGQYSPESDKLLGEFMRGSMGVKDEKKGPFVVGGNLVDESGKALFTAEKPVAAKSLEQAYAEAVSSGDAAAQAKILSALKQKSDAERAPKDERIVQVDDGKGGSVWVRESAAVGKGAPIRSDARSVRPVTSGDANRISEVNSSLSMLDSLPKPGETGFLPWVEAKFPDVVTGLTGIGAEAKSRQAAIQLVKQIIGKGLEGGVLRKEDEAKYERIIPTLSDAPEVVKSKIQGLRAALARKKDEHLSALEDAGYDVSKYKARGDRGANDPLGIR